MAARKLSNKPKETRKQKLERKAENAKIKQQFTTIVLPTIIVIILLIFLYVYSRTRPTYPVPAAK